MFQKTCRESIYGRHKFVARYTETHRDIKITKASGFHNDELRRLCTLNTYVGDVCEYCGEVVNKLDE